MEKFAYIFIGQSGSGKGTQVSLLQEKIKTIYPHETVLHLETGLIFRSFITEENYTATMTSELMAQGILPPSFIGVHVWSHALINQYTGQRFVCIDGTPRILEEVPILLSAARFYGWKLKVIYLEVGDTWANERLIARKRPDDLDTTERAARIAWFHSNVIPALELLKQSVDICVINGERSILEIHEEICEKLRL